MTSKTDTYSTGDLVMLWDEMFDRGGSADWEGYFIGIPKKMKLHGKIGVVICRNEVFDDIYESCTWWVLVEGKKEEVHINYMRKVEDNADVR